MKFSLEDIRMILGALSLAEERIVELSGWCKIPADGETLDDVREAIKFVNAAESLVFEKYK